MLMKTLAQFGFLAEAEVYFLLYLCAARSSFFQVGKGPFWADEGEMK